jgi:hypothetical protein
LDQWDCRFVHCNYLSRWHLNHNENVIVTKITDHRSRTLHLWIRPLVFIKSQEQIRALIVQSLLIQPIRWRNYLVEKETSRWLSDAYNSITLWLYFNYSQEHLFNLKILQKNNDWLWKILQKYTVVKCQLLGFGKITFLIDVYQRPYSEWGNDHDQMITIKRSVFMSKLLREIQLMRKKIPASINSRWPMQGTTAKWSNPFNLISKFTSDRHQLERNLSRPKSWNFTTVHVFKILKIS